MTFACAIVIILGETGEANEVERMRAGRAEKKENK